MVLSDQTPDPSRCFWCPLKALWKQQAGRRWIGACSEHKDRLRTITARG